MNAEQRDPYATYEMLQRLAWTDVEIERATSAFTAGGQRYPAGSWVVRTAQPLGNWADQVLGVDVYPEVRDCDTCPVMVPYAEATSSLPLQLGVDVAEVREEFSASLERVTEVELPAVTMPPAPPNGKGVYLVTPESYGTIQIATALQESNVFTWRAAEDFALEGASYPAGTYVVPATPQARSVLSTAAPAVGVPVHAANSAPRVDAVQLKPGTRVGLYRGANNMPGGWDMWLMEEYGVNFEVVGAQDFDHDLNDLYDTIVLSHGMSRSRIVDGLDPERYDEEFSWAYGVGEEGWAELHEFVEDGGTLLAVGSAVGTAKDLVNLPITEALPKDRDEFFTGGSLIRNVFDNDAPAGWGMPEEWPVWLYNTQAWHPTDDSAQVVASYPDEGDLLASGYLRGEEHLRGAANVLSFSVGEGTVVTYGSEVTFRSLPRQQFTLLYNMIYAGPGAEVTDKQMHKLTPAFTADGTPVAETGKGKAPSDD